MGHVLAILVLTSLVGADRRRDGNLKEMARRGFRIIVVRLVGGCTAGIVVVGVGCILVTGFTSRVVIIVVQVGGGKSIS